MANDEYYGNWYLPANPQIEFAGILKVNRIERSIVLTVYSSIKPDGSQFSRDPHDREVLADIVVGNIQSIERQVTLFAISGAFFEFPIGKDLRQYTFHANYAFFGHAFSSVDDIKFEKLAFRVSYLGIWLDVLTTNLMEYDFETQLPKFLGEKTIKVELDNCNVELYRGAGGTSSNYSFNKQVKHYLKTCFEAETSFWDHFSRMARFKQFLHFAIGEPVETIDCFSDEHFQHEVLAVSWTYEDSKKAVAHRMPFKAQNFQEEYLIERIKNWFTFSEEFSACLSVFDNAVRPVWVSGSRSVTHTQFTNGILNVCQAYEGFFKKDERIEFSAIKTEFLKSKGEIITKIKNHNQKIGLTNDEMKFLNNNLMPRGNKNEYEFQNIILEFCKRQKEAISDLIPEDRFEEFAGELKNLRNTLTHINHNDDEELSEGDKVFRIFNTSQALFYAMVMDKIGFQQSEIRKMLINVKGFM